LKKKCSKVYFIRFKNVKYMRVRKLLQYRKCINNFIKIILAEIWVKFSFSLNFFYFFILKVNLFGNFCFIVFFVYKYLFIYLFINWCIFGWLDGLRKKISWIWNEMLHMHSLFVIHYYTGDWTNIVSTYLEEIEHFQIYNFLIRSHYKFKTNSKK